MTDRQNGKGCGLGTLQGGAEIAFRAQREVRPCTKERQREVPARSQEDFTGGAGGLEGKGGGDKQRRRCRMALSHGFRVLAERGPH
eukprot:CAMPEP_0177583098 /NCGR_PEP_ID=MMETSP0419_2-20121207/3131_1 /TAXON_ID=582737 /ORGANISM="Tetraselmis sp., Strain GSL018" /LENGTH=85 /DNA_ID=CAMNT_0019072447 /DNA_START=1040 /DNA_END=1297 /DNA_ORIENTATION=+